MKDFSWLCGLAVRAGLTSVLFCAGSVAVGQTMPAGIGPWDLPGPFTLLDPNVTLPGPVSGALPPVLATPQPDAVVAASYVANPVAQPMTAIGPTPPPQPMIGTAAAIAPPSVVQPGIVQPGVLQSNAVQPNVAQPPSVAIAAAAPIHPMACAPAPIWYLDVETLFLWRDNNFQWFVANDFDAGVGPKILLRLGSDPDYALEAEYFSSLGMQASSKPLFASSSVAFALQTEYDSSLHNVELNFVRRWDTLALLAGFRYLQLGETFHWSIRNASVAPFPSDADAETNNNLFGGQLGLRWRKDGDRLFFEATGKAGVYENAANGKHSIIVQNTTFESKETKDTAVAFVADIGLATGWHLSDVWTLRTDYNLLWANSLAMAPDQLYLGNAPAPIYAERRLFMHGVGIGLEAVW